MKTKFDADDLNLISLAKEYSSERKARKLFEANALAGRQTDLPALPKRRPSQNHFQADS